MASYQTSVPVTVDIDSIVDAVIKRLSGDRIGTLTARYGEACNRKKAAEIIGCSPVTISSLIRDGRINSACEGTRVDVRSLAEYIEDKPNKDRQAKIKRRMERTGIHGIA